MGFLAIGGAWMRVKPLQQRSRRACDQDDDDPSPLASTAPRTGSPAAAVREETAAFPDMLSIGHAIATSADEFPRMRISMEYVRRIGAYPTWFFRVRGCDRDPGWQRMRMPRTARGSIAKDAVVHDCNKFDFLPPHVHAHRIDVVQYRAVLY